MLEKQFTEAAHGSPPLLLGRLRSVPTCVQIGHASKSLPALKITRATVDARAVKASVEVPRQNTDAGV